MREMSVVEATDNERLMLGNRPSYGDEDRFDAVQDRLPVAFWMRPCQEHSLLWRPLGGEGLAVSDHDFRPLSCKGGLLRGVSG